MPREDNVELPIVFRELAAARSLGGPLRAMRGGSRLQGWRDKQLVIGIFQHGAVVGLDADPQPFAFRYDEVDRFTQWVVAKYVNGSYRGTDITCWIGRSDGQAYRVGGETTRSVRHIVDDFRELVDPRIAAAQLPKMQAALRQGHSVDFGGYVLEPDGLYVPARFGKGKRLAWADVQEVNVKAGSVQVSARGKRWTWASVAVQRVPNLTAFLTLVRAQTAG